MTQLEKLKKVFDELGIKYHELQTGEYTYIQKLAAHDEKNLLYVMGKGLIPLTDANQLLTFFEFENGNLVSW